MSLKLLVGLVFPGVVILTVADAKKAAQLPPIGTLFVVNSTGDQPEATPDSDCETVVGNGVCTLRAAIQLVNSRNNGGDGISIGVTGTITLNSALPNLSVPVNISGPGANNITIARNLNSGAFRIFNVTTTTGILNISGLTISNGVASGNGGGIQRAGAGNVNVTNCTISNNHGIDGGGVANATTGQISLTNCLMDSNSSQLSNGDSHGGAIYNPSGTVTLSGCTLSNNTATGGAYIGYGGGIYNDATLIISSSTIDGNTATSSASFTSGGYGFGGGIYNDGALQITNSTIISNIATSAPGSNGFTGGNGGGIYNFGTAIITNDTIAYNTSTGGTFNSDAGGIQTDNTASHIQVKSCIIAKNIGSGSDVSGAFTSGGFNLIGAIDGSVGFTTGTDQAGTESAPLDPQFDDQIGDNGGPTQTLGLLCGSPAIDKGTSNGLTGALSTDQRGTGFARTVDDGAIPNATGGDGTDIGAFEYGAGPVLPTSVVSRKFHGSLQSFFDIPLSLSCTSLGVECRRNTGSDTSGPNVGRDHQLILTFGSNIGAVNSADVVNNVTGFPGGSATFSASSNVVTVNLHSIPNPALLTINLRGVSDGTHSGLVSIPLGVVAGDTTGNGIVNSADVSQTKSMSGQTITSGNFRIDVTVDGTLNSSDVSSVKSKSGTALP